MKIPIKKMVRAFISLTFRIFSYDVSIEGIKRGTILPFQWHLVEIQELSGGGSESGSGRGIRINNESPRILYPRI